MRNLVAILALMLPTPSPAQSVASTRTIRAGAILGAGDVTVLDQTSHGAYRRVEQVIGKETRRILYPGRPIARDDIGAPAVVTRNQVVTLVYDNGALTISTQGRALSRGGIGDYIKAMNLSSHAVISGMVSAPGEIRVGP